MELQKINVKFFVAERSAFQITDFIDIFHSWIQKSDGSYYDVADYSHIHAGPGIILVSHEANISMDNAGDRLGLLYNRKQLLTGSNQEKLEDVFKSALEFCRRIENEERLKGKIRFVGDEILFVINDRLLAPNTDEILEAVKPDLEELAKRLFAGADFQLSHRQGPRDRFAVAIKASAAVGIAPLLRNLENEIQSDRGNSWATTRSLWN